MTALPLPPQRLPLTVVDYVALGEDPDGVRYELQEGNLVMAASPIPEHQICIDELMYQLRGSVPAGYRPHHRHRHRPAVWSPRPGPGRSVGLTSWS